MYDYINRDAVFDWFCESADIDGCVDLPKNNGSCKKGCRHCIDGKELDEIPTADVRENVHAHWITHEYKVNGYDHAYCECSACNANRPITLFPLNFCSNCGAVMDERSEDGEIHNC